MTKSHVHVVRVYYEDTDFSGFVYHAAYVKFLERGRTEFLRALSLVQSDMHRDGLAFVVSRMELDYLRPAGMDDLLEVTTAVGEIGGASLRLIQAVSRGTLCLVRAEVTVAAVRGGRAVRLPRGLHEAFAAGTVGRGTRDESASR